MANTLPIGATISQAWEKVSGAKGSIWAAIGVMFLATIVIGFVSGLINQASSMLGFVLNLAGQLVMTLLQMGVLYIGIQRAKNCPITYKQLSYVFDLGMIVKIIGVYVIEFLILLPLVALYALPLFIFLGLSFNQPFTFEWNSAGILFIVWSALMFTAIISITVRIYLSMAFVLDQKLGALSAVKMSFKASKGNVLALIALFFFQMAVIFLSIFTLGIALIWVIPLLVILYGMTYKNIL